MTTLKKNAESNNLVKPLLQAVFLLPYVPHRLYCMVQGEGKKKFDLQGVSDINWIDLHEKDKTVNEQYDVEDVIPILRPLSDFYDINAPAFIDTNFDISTQLVLVDLCSKKQHYSGIRYSDMQEFLREHIDVFNLIEQDLAVSVHDVV